MSARDRLEAAAVRTVAALPRPLQRRLAGRPIEIDGQRLDPEIQLLLRLDRTELSEQPASVSDARAERSREANVFRGERFDVLRAEDLVIPGSAGPLPARLYVPHTAPPSPPLLVYLHGGGWVVCDLDTHDNVCRFLAAEAGVLVLSIGYRLAPEHRFPSAVDDALAAFRHAFENTRDFGGAPDAVAVAGDSAGGNLALVVVQLAKAEGGPTPAFCLSFYPVTDLSVKRRSYRLFGEDFVLTEAQMDWYRAHYLPGEDAKLDPRVSPLLADDLSGLPPTHIVTAGFDPLRDEGEEYARRLSEAGVAVTLRRHPGLVHGFVNAVGSTRFGRAATAEAVGALRMGLAGSQALRSRVR